MSDVNKRLGATIRRRRVMLGMTQGAIGQAVDLTCQQIQKYETGASHPTLAMIVDIAKALGISAVHLITLALGATDIETGGSDRATLELVKRFATLQPNEKQGVLLLIQQLAKEGV